MSDELWWHPSGTGVAHATTSTESARLSSYIHFEIGGHDLLLERVREAPSNSLGVYRVTVDDEVQPDLEVEHSDLGDRELLLRAYDDWRERRRGD